MINKYLTKGRKTFYFLLPSICNIQTSASAFLSNTPRFDHRNEPTYSESTTTVLGRYKRRLLAWSSANRTILDASTAGYTPGVSTKGFCWRRDQRLEVRDRCPSRGLFEKSRLLILMAYLISISSFISFLSVLLLFRPLWNYSSWKMYPEHRTDIDTGA